MIQTRKGRLYTGITTDVARRWQQHCTGKGGARFFRSDRPASLALVETLPCRSTASRREAAIKRLSPQQKWRLVATQGPVRF